MEGDITAGNLYELLERQHYTCVLSGRQLEPDTAALDHVVPLSRGGKHELPNVQWLDKEINQMKGQNTNDEFIALCNIVVERAKSRGQIAR